MAIKTVPVPAHSRNQWQRVVIDEIIRETEMTKTFKLRPQNWHLFQSGQHVNVRLTAPDGYQAQRSYSVASSPLDAGRYELTIDRLENGEVSTWFHDVAKIGDSFELRGPFGGHFVWEPTTGTPVLFVAGGSGVVPILSMIRHRAQAAPDTTAVLLHAARRWSDVIARDELLDREQREHNLTVLYALSRDTVSRPQDFDQRINAGAVAAALKALGRVPVISYVCGSNGFAEDITQLLTSAGLETESIRTERFGEQS